ncbi:MAG TPA: hypothetical protein VMU12_01925 [Candidatus Paceibacterota bacterium]|nr:hypothetical protein [Candidatus Paceibacterota bacterium]
MTNEPWFVKKITVHEYTDDKGRDDTVLYILLSPKSNATLEEQYALGEFFRDRVIGERRIVK